MPRTDVIEAKTTAEIATIKRRQKLSAWNDYISFGVVKGAGLLSFLSGSISLINPNYLPIHLENKQAQAALGIGLALLAGHQFVAVVSRIINGLKQ